MEIDCGSIWRNISSVGRRFVGERWPKYALNGGFFSLKFLGLAKIIDAKYREYSCVDLVKQVSS